MGSTRVILQPLLQVFRMLANCLLEYQYNLPHRSLVFLTSHLFQVLHTVFVCFPFVAIRFSYFQNVWEISSVVYCLDIILFAKDFYQMFSTQQCFLFQSLFYSALCSVQFQFVLRVKLDTISVVRAYFVCMVVIIVHFYLIFYIGLDFFLLL